MPTLESQIPERKTRPKPATPAHGKTAKGKNSTKPQGQTEGKRTLSAGNTECFELADTLAILCNRRTRPNEKGRVDVEFMITDGENFIRCGSPKAFLAAVNDLPYADWVVVDIAEFITATVSAFGQKADTLVEWAIRKTQEERLVAGVNYKGPDFHAESRRARAKIHALGSR